MDKSIIKYLKAVAALIAVIFVIGLVIFGVDKLVNGSVTYEQIKVVVADKFTWPPIAENTKTYTDGETTISTFSDIEYNLELTDGKANNYIEVTKEEYDKVKEGTFVTVWQKTESFVGGVVIVYWLPQKYSDDFDKKSDGTLIINGQGIEK